MTSTDCWIYIDEANKELRLIKQPVSDEQPRHCFGTKIQIMDTEACFSQQDFCNPPEGHFIKIPAQILTRTGIVPRYMLKDARAKSGACQIEENQESQKYFLYFDEKKQELLLLQQEIPADSLAASKTIDAQCDRDFSDFNDIQPEEFIQRYGRAFKLHGRHVKIKRGMLYVPRMDKLIKIPLYLLLAAKLTTLGIIKSIAGKYVFDRK